MQIAAVTFTSFSDRFWDLVDRRESLIQLSNHGRFTEGPVWLAETRSLIWSDIPNSRMLRWRPDMGVDVFRPDSRFANGNARDRQGRLVTAEQSARRVTRTEADGSITVLADAFEGKRLNSPNDLIVKSDGSIWFTDPTYGLRDCFPGLPSELAHEHVFRIDPITGEVRSVASDFQKPNGIAFSPDEQWLYVADSAVSDHPTGNSHIRRFRIGTDGTPSDGEIFVTTEGTPDGFRFDSTGNLWTSAGAGINIYTPGAEWLGRIHLPADVSNLTFLVG